MNAVFPPTEAWTHSIRSLASTIEGDEFNADKLLEGLRIQITQPELPSGVDYVRVMSLHKSKGLTADLVVVIGCIEGLIPTISGETEVEQAASLEEQRRLFYVAVTRSRRILILSSVTQLPRKDAHRMKAPIRGKNQAMSGTIASRFLDELGPSRPPAILGSNYFEGAEE